MAWYDGIEGLDDNTTGFIKAQGLDALEAPQAAAKAVVSLFQAQQKLGADPSELVRFPKAPDAPEWGAVYERLGVPKEATAYDLSGVKRQDGSAPTPEFLQHVRDTAFAGKMTNAQAVAYAQGQLGFEAKQQQAQQQQRTVANQVALDALKGTHGANYPVFEFRARKAGELLGISGDVWDAVANSVGVEKLMNQMHNLGLKMSESELLGPGNTNPGGTPAYSPAEAQARKDQLYADTAFVERFGKGDAQALQEIRNLDRIIHRRAIQR